MKRITRIKTNCRENELSELERIARIRLKRIPRIKTDYTDFCDGRYVGKTNGKGEPKKHKGFRNPGLERLQQVNFPIKNKNVSQGFWGGENELLELRRITRVGRIGGIGQFGRMTWILRKMCWNRGAGYYKK